VLTFEWEGNPPATDDEAVERILAATRYCIDDHGVGTTITDVAQVLGISRQAISCYFDSTEDLLNAFTIDWTCSNFIDELVDHVADLHEPAEVVVEWIAFSIEKSDSYLGILLNSGRIGAYASGFTSETAIALGRLIAERFSVDWQAVGFDDRLLTELIGHVLRTIESLVLCPLRPEHNGASLRRYLRRWVAPAIEEMASRTLNT
jgi:AcrR family transcriptional regulator